MKFLGFNAAPDLMGRRIRLTWSWALDPLETPAQVPDVLVRRKTRDFAFPPLAVPDPYLVHDSAAFPPPPVPGTLTVTDLPDRTQSVPGLTGRISAVSVARSTPGGALEVQRQTEMVWRDGHGRTVRIDVIVLDADRLAAGELYYYELDDGSAPGPTEVGAYRGIARAGEVWGLNRRLWDLLPETCKGADASPMPLAATIAGIPEAGRAGGQLKRFIDTFGMGLDALRNGAEGLRFLRDVETTPPVSLAALGRQIGWEVSPALPIEQSRNEVETATRLFALGGTVQALRALVAHQTGWRAQAAEMAAGIARTGVPGQGPLRIAVERPGAPGSFIGGLDAAPLLAFPAGGTSGGPGSPALLVAAIAGPYALRPGFELTLSINGAPPTRIVFGEDDFGDIAAASAAEIAAVIERHFDEVTAYSQAGALALETLLDGVEASLRVETSRDSLLALSELADGRISAVTESGHVRLVYATRQERAAPNGATKVLSRLVTKSWGFDEWRDAQALPDWADGAPEAAAAWVAGGLWLAFGGSGRGLSLARGLARAPEPARLTTAKAGPFALLAGQRLTLLTGLGPETFLVNPGDYAVVAAATAAEIAAALNAQMANVGAVALADGAVRVSTVAAGSRAWLSVDLAHSTIARTLGLAARDLRSQGTWDDTLDWAAPEAGPCTQGVLGSPAAVPYGGGAVLGWAEHQDGVWQVRCAKWQKRVTLATPNGVAEGLPGGPWAISTTADGLPSNAIRAVVADARGVLAAATGAGLGLRRTGGSWTTITTVGGLPSDDLRALTLLPDGTLAVATPAGLAEVSPGGAIAVTKATVHGLLDNDLRALYATPDGDLLVGSAGGLSLRSRFGRWSRWTAADGLPAGPIVAVAARPGRGRWAASALGMAAFRADVWSAVTAADGLPSSDIRSLSVTADGSILVATAGGLARLDPDAARWRRITPAEGLPMADCRSVTLGPDNRLLAAGAAGLAVSAPGGNGPWALFGVADGLPAGGALGLDGAWSPALVVAGRDGGTVEPHLAVTADGRLWLAFAARVATAAEDRDRWSLRLRRFDPATALWGAEQALSVAPPAGAADRKPFVLPRAAGGARLFFNTDRSGGRGLAEISVDAAGVPGAAVLFALDSAEAWAPCAAQGPGGELWMFHRGDRPFSLSQAATLAPAGNAPRPSLRLADAATLFSPAGLRTPVLAHLTRHAMRNQLGDPMLRTPDEPDKGGGLPGDPVPLHTRRTVVLHLGPAPFGLVPTQERLQQLMQLLNRFKPINVRLRLVIRPAPLVEAVYPIGDDLLEAWADDVPVADALGQIAEALSISYPGLAVLHAYELASRSVAFADPATFRRRTWFPDLI